MKKKFKLGIIGAGFMSQAIIKGIINGKKITNEQILVSDINQSSLENLNSIGIKTTIDNEEVFANCEYILLAIKPQTFLSLQIKNSIKVEKIISIMAGVNKAKIKEVFPNAKVVRCMPNTPVSVGFGAVGVDDSEFDNESDKKFVTDLFFSVAKVVYLEEDKLATVTGISGSSPAYFYLFAKSLIDAGVKNGLTEKEAENLVVATMRGSADMINNRGEKTLSDLIAAVCSKGGTTIEAINVLNNENLSNIVDKAVDACIKRALEIEKL